jgi:hypothetical protein
MNSGQDLGCDIRDHDGQHPGVCAGEAYFAVLAYQQDVAQAEDRGNP